MQIKPLGLIIAFIIFWAIPKPGSAQSSGNIGIETQVYPAGVILGLRGGLDVGNHNEFNLRIGYNITRRGNFGEHDNEEGGGPGLGLGYRLYLMNKLNGLFLGARTDLWFMDIDWEDDNPFREGSTEITVLQPTLEVGYNILKNNADWFLSPAVSFGYELNIRTAGEEVGEGTILLGGLNFGYEF